MRKFKIDKQKSKAFGYSTACGIGMGMTSFLFEFLMAATAHIAATDNNIKTIMGISIGIGVLSIPAFYSVFKENKMIQEQEKENKNVVKINIKHK